MYRSASLSNLCACSSIDEHVSENSFQHEKFAETKKRLQIRIGASDKDIAKYRFALIQISTFKQPTYIEDGEYHHRLHSPLHVTLLFRGYYLRPQVRTRRCTRSRPRRQVGQDTNWRRGESNCYQRLMCSYKLWLVWIAYGLSNFTHCTFFDSISSYNLLLVLKEFVQSLPMQHDMY